MIKNPRPEEENVIKDIKKFFRLKKKSKSIYTKKKLKQLKMEY